MVFSGSTSTGGVSLGTGTALTLTPEDANEIARQCPAVLDVAPTVRARSQIVYRNRNWVPDQITGTTPSYLVVRDWENLSLGEMFSNRDVRNGNKVCVIGDTIKRNLFRNVSPIGKEIRINNVSFEVVGVLRRKGANMMGMDQDNIVLAPWTTIKFRVSGTTLTNTNQSASAGGTASATSTDVNTLSNLYPDAISLYPTRSATQLANYPQPVRFINIDQILVKAVSDTKISQAISQMTTTLRRIHRISAGDEDDFSIRDMTEMTTMLSSTTQSMSTLLLVVALISLVVGGVGIMNIMLVSVTERTREIGLRMAVGAAATTFFDSSSWRQLCCALSGVLLGSSWDAPHRFWSGGKFVGQLRHRGRQSSPLSPFPWGSVLLLVSIRRGKRHAWTRLKPFVTSEQCRRPWAHREDIPRRHEKCSPHIAYQR